MPSNEGQRYGATPEQIHRGRAFQKKVDQPRPWAGEKSQSHRPGLAHHGMTGVGKSGEEAFQVDLCALGNGCQSSGTQGVTSASCRSGRSGSHSQMPGLFSSV